MLTDFNLNIIMSNIISNTSKLSIGLYQGADNDEVDFQLSNVIQRAIINGINNFDVAPNYRNTRSEIILGNILNSMKELQISISTKGGFVPFDFSDTTINESNYIKTNYIDKELVTKETFDYYHFQSFDPRYLEHEFNMSLSRLKVDIIDLYYIHNPEYLLSRMNKEQFLKHMNVVFLWLKEKIENNKIKQFGISTWDGFFYEDTTKRLQLCDFVDIAIENNISDYFIAIQFPFSLLKTDAFSKTTQFLDNKLVSLVRAAVHFNIRCITSAPFGQGMINQIILPDKIKNTFFGFNNFQKALSFTLSAPHIDTVVLGTTKLNHLEQAIEVLNFKQHSQDSFFNVFKL